VIFIGDVHGNWQEYAAICRRSEQTLQLGDFGIGFHGDEDPEPHTLADPSVHRFLRGNHDNPAVCREREGCLPDWGFDKEMDLFWVSGGFSIDYEYRTPGLNWWSDEEISYEELMTVIEAYKEAKPRIVASHECPSEAQFTMFPHTSKREIRNRTKEAFQAMFEAHQPEFWVFGHYHCKALAEIGSTMFACCADVIPNRKVDHQIPNVTFEIEGLEWR